MENALTEYNNMASNGRSLPQILDDVENDLRSRPGMGRQRHDDLLALLGTAEQALNGGILTETVPWLMVAGHNRRIEDLRRRIDTRLNMVALDMQEREKARQRAGTKFPRHTEVDDGLTDYQRMQAAAQR
jgi:hypothetical protein